MRSASWLIRTWDRLAGFVVFPWKSLSQIGTNIWALLPFLLKFSLILWPLFAFDFPGAVFGCVFLCATNKAWDAQKTGQNWLLRFGFCAKQTPKTHGGVLGPKADRGWGGPPWRVCILSVAFM